VSAVSFFTVFNGILYYHQEIVHASIRNVQRSTGL
jgi:hypothetical protein